MSSDDVWIKVVQVILGIAISLVAWWVKQQGETDKRIHERIDKIKDTQEQHGKDIATMNEQIRNLPNGKDVTELRATMAQTNMQLAELQGGQRILTDLLTRMIQDPTARARSPSARSRRGD